MTRREDFVLWLEAQLGSAYVWGAQGHRVESDGRVLLHGREVSKSRTHWLSLKENSEQNARRAAAFIENRFRQGQQSLACYDCSGLIMAYMRDIKNYLKCDMTSRALFTCCDKVAKADLVKGDLVFYHNGERVVHVGAYVGGGNVIDSRSRDAGVIKTPLESFGWNRFGRLALLDQSGSPCPYFALCSGGSVYIRNAADKSGAVITTAHKGDRLLAVEQNEGWCAVAACVDNKIITGYISKKYIEAV